MNQQDLYQRARKVLPAGGFGNFDPQVFIREGHGSRVWDEDGNEYVDCLIGSGPMILGHGHPEVLEALHQQLGKGTTFFANNALAIDLAEEICRSVACAEQLRFLSSGTEANMYAMRVARAFTGKDKILKFEGGYHGMSAEAQMSLAPDIAIDYPVAVPDSGGIPESIRNEVLVAPFNNIEFATNFLFEHADEIAGVLVEPMQRTIPPAKGFLETLQQVCKKYGIVLIFDEIVTGFRLAYGGAQEKFDVVPDLCTLGKIIGGGLPLSAVTGRAEIMSHFDANIVQKKDYLMQIGTLSGNPLATSAGLKTLEILRRPKQYEKLQHTGEAVMQLFHKHLNAAEIPHQITGVPVLFDIVFQSNSISNYRDMSGVDGNKAKMFNLELRDNGVMKALNKFYTSLALNDEDISVLDLAIQKSTEVIARI